VDPAVGHRSPTLRVALNVGNLLLRPPVVVARSIASLDLLTGGRVELGLGTGAFWDAIVAAGGQRLSASESVDALEEAIEIVRAVWQPEGSPAVRVEGTHHRVVGLHPGPAPAHQVEIWLGAYKPRMLRVTGRLADGWLPSMGYADPAALGGMNRIIDEAAVKSGRDPAAIRRLYNVSGGFGAGGRGLSGTPRDWAEQLTELALAEGMSTFILGTDSVSDVRTFGEEVAPLVRDLVDAERARAAAAPGPDEAERSSLATAEEAQPDRKGATTAYAQQQSQPLQPSPRAVTELTVRPTPDDGTRLSDQAAWDESTRRELLHPLALTGFQ